MSSEEPKEKLEKLIRKSKEKGVEIIKLTNSITQWGQEVSDLADASIKVIRYPPPLSFDWENSIDAWEHLLAQQDDVIGGLTRFAIAPVITSGSAPAFSMVDYANPNSFVDRVPLDRQVAARNDAEQLGHVLDKLADKQSVLAAMQQAGLDKAASGKKSAVELFETGWAAFEKPVTLDSPASTSLLPIRESIKESIESLLRRRPTQEPTKNEYAKIVSIGNHFAYDGTTQEDIQSWANRWSMRGGLLDELSGSKDSALTREEWQSTIRKATLFLREFLQGLDHRKFKCFSSHLGWNAPTKFWWR